MPEVLPLTDKWEWGYTKSDDRPHTILKFGAPEQRLIWEDRNFNQFEQILTVPLTDAERDTIDVFLHARKYYEETFYIKDPRDFQRLNGGPGLVTLSGGPTVWSLPTTGRYAGDHPLTTGHQLYDDGTPHASTPDTDARTFTTTSISGVITVDYDFYRLCRLLSPPQWRPVAPDVWVGTLSFLEVTS